MSRLSLVATPSAFALAANESAERAILTMASEHCRTATNEAARATSLLKTASGADPDIKKQMRAEATRSIRRALDALAEVLGEVGE